jgi:HTH-type transcriptional regulator, competence development regulator
LPNGVDKLLNVEYIINMATTFGELLREKRRAAGLSQRQLADRAGVDFSYISKLENSRLPAAADETVVRICDILGCPAEEFFTAAKKLPTELGESLAGEPAAIRFLQEASRLQLSQREWERMLGELHGLRGGDE